MTRILFVDDEPLVLEGLTHALRRRYRVQTATSGAEALEMMRADNGQAVVISDMRMPGMDGATFLREARRLAPDAVRILLTGHADMDAAKRAASGGHIFRFLTKPCRPATLLEAVGFAAEHHRLVTAERELLEETLRDTVATLVDVFALANPLEFGRAARVKQTVTELARSLEVEARWQVEVAAMLSQLGLVTLPPETARKWHEGRTLTHAEAAMVARAPAVTQRLLAHIPRLGTVRAMLAIFAGMEVPEALASPEEEELTRQGARLLRVAADFDALLSEGHTPGLAVDILRGRGTAYDTRALEALSARHGSREPPQAQGVPREGRY